MTIKVLEKTPGSMPETFAVGDWIDLKTADEVVLEAPTVNRLRKKLKGSEEKVREVVFHPEVLSLGVCIQVPKGYECIVVPRSSTFKKFGILQTNSIGVIDQTYCSDQDIWRMSILPTRSVVLPKGTRIAQFRVQLSQYATPWQKFKAIFSSRVKLKKVSSLSNPTRGGFGSTDK